MGSYRTNGDSEYLPLADACDEFNLTSKQRAYSELSQNGANLNEKQVISNLTNCVIGVGVLSVPYAFRLSGYSSLPLILVSIVVTSSTAVFIGRSLDLANQCSEAESVPIGARDFAFLAQVAFGNIGRVLIGAITSLEIWFALITFMVMNGVNARLILPSLGSSIPVLGSCALMAANVFLPMKAFSLLSLISSVALVVASVALIGAAMTMPRWYNPYDQLGSTALVQLGNIPRSIGIIIFCFAGHPCFPMVHQSMKDQRRWVPCVAVTFLTAFVYYGGLGTFGYLVFGQDLRESFTENLDGLEGAILWRNISAAGFFIKIQFTAPLLLKAILEILWPRASGEPTWSVRRIIAVWCLSVLTAFMAIVFSNDVAVAASLTGSLFTMTTSVIFPAVVHVQLRRRVAPDTKGPVTWVPHCFILVFGVAMACSGTYLAVIDFLVKIC